MTPRMRRAVRSAGEYQVLDAPSHDEIAVRAFEVFQRRGEQHGRDLDDWLQAERELLIERSGPLEPADPLPEVDEEPASGPLGFVQA